MDFHMSFFERSVRGKNFAVIPVTLRNYYTPFRTSGVTDVRAAKPAGSPLETQIV
jgi:hypothetical protein